MSKDKKTDTKKPEKASKKKTDKKAKATKKAASEDNVVEAETPKENVSTQTDRSVTGFPAVIHGQYVRDLSFENPYAPHAILAARERPEVSIDINLDYQKLDPIAQNQKGDLYEVVVKVHVISKIGEQTAFIIDLEHGTSCTIRPDFPEEHVEPFLLTEMPHYSFPFIRQVIAESSAQGGFKPLYMAPVNFVMLYQKRLQAEGKVKASA